MASRPEAPFLDCASKPNRIVAARVSITTSGKHAYPADGYYFAREDETPNKIAKMFGVDVEKLVKINKVHYEELLTSSKLKGGTRITLPVPNFRWMLTEQLGKGVKTEKKKRYTVRDIEPDFPGGDPSTRRLYENIESKRVQEYPQLYNSYAQGEVVCALWPDVKGDYEPDPANNQHWLTEFSYAIFRGYVPGDYTRATLKYENNDYSLDHGEEDKVKVVPVSVIIKREKRDRDDDDSAAEIHIIDPAYEALGMRKFIFDSMTKCWHDSMHMSRAIKFQVVLQGVRVSSNLATAAQQAGQDAEMQDAEDRPPTPPSPPRYSADQVLERCEHGDGAVNAQALWVPDMTAVNEGQSWARMDDAGTEEERKIAAEKPHMAWWYPDIDGRLRSLTARRPIDTLREPAPYIVLW
jgi:hypothetical protein